MDELKDYLDAIYPINEITWERIKILFKPGSLKKGQYFIREGKRTNHIGFLINGIVRAFYTNRNGQEYTKQFFTAHSIIGSYSSVITQKPGLFSQVALTDCTILSINYNEIVSLYDQHADLERLGRKFAENYFVANEAKEIEIVLENAETRYLKFRNQFPGLEQLIPQYYVASYLGITPTQLSRIRNKISRR